ncbi:hypothetical protein [Ahrensia kielensis]|uniref:hypothetical protein n=1 Tax=Ahrensia kielensis TaxID=76980 RepID=UPI00036CC05C|nr:hypothetical protein [Ahrensia kielensis]
MTLRAIIVILTVFTPILVHAQGISETSVVGKEMTVRTVDSNVAADAFTDFTKDSRNTANEIRVLTAPQEVQIVKLGERRVVGDEKIEEAMREERENIEELRSAIQINAILMDVLDTQKIGIPQVVGAKFTGDKKIEIYAFAAHDE